MRPDKCLSWCIFDRGACRFCGHPEKREPSMPTLRIYDITTDAYRDATQVDLDQLQTVANAYGRLRDTIAEHHATLMAEVKAIRSKAGVPG
jgi:hypothetical protein